MIPAGVQADYKIQPRRYHRYRLQMGGSISRSASRLGLVPWRACHYSHSQATRLPLQIHQSTLAGELARFSREFPRNRFRVAPTGEAAASDEALVSGLVSAGP